MSFNWSSVGRKVADTAPLLGAALGGPAGGAIGALVASVLGTSSSPEAVLAALKTDPSAMLKIQELEQQDRESLRSHVLEISRIHLADTQQARTVHQSHWMPWALTLLLATMVSFSVAGLLLISVPDGSKEVLFYLVGQLVTAFLTAVGYWLGTSLSSTEKSRQEWVRLDPNRPHRQGE